MATTTDRKYSCESASETLEWMNAIADFIRPYRTLIDAHVVNFFKDRLWEIVDKDWMECLRKESVDSLLGIPCGFVQEYCPTSLQEFVLKLRSLALPRQRKSFHADLILGDTTQGRSTISVQRSDGSYSHRYGLQLIWIAVNMCSQFMMVPNLHVASLGTVLSQGMNSKKKHEVEVLAAVVNAIACGAGAHTIVDVGSGQGYLAQTLSFEYQLSVVAIDASLHHSTVTAARAERIKKHYAAKLRKSGYENRHLKAPQVVTCHVLSSDMLTTLSTSPYKGNRGQGYSLGNSISERKGSSCQSSHEVSSLVLAGLHACGDLSVSMLRTFAECEQVKALVVIGCCYNLLSEEVCENGCDPRSFPMSTAAKRSSLNLGKNARDLACQSAERWGNLTEDDALQNFELHAFRAAFQMVLDKHFPGVLMSSPSIGRQGKALRRQQLRKSIESQFSDGEKYISTSNSNNIHIMKDNSLTMNSSKSKHTCGHDSDAEQSSPRDDKCTASLELKFHCDMTIKEALSFKKSDECILFKSYSERGLNRLNLGHLSDSEIVDIWREAQPFSELVGPFWSLRAALGQLIETYILLDRLLFLQERDNLIEACIFPIFDPTISPRNVAIIAHKCGFGA